MAYMMYIIIYIYIHVYIYINRKAIAHATRNTHPTYDEFSVDAQNDALDGPLNNMSNSWYLYVFCFRGKPRH